MCFEMHILVWQIMIDCSWIKTFVKYRIFLIHSALFNGSDRMTDFLREKNFSLKPNNPTAFRRQDHIVYGKICLVLIFCVLRVEVRPVGSPVGTVAEGSYVCHLLERWERRKLCSVCSQAYLQCRSTVCYKNQCVPTAWQYHHQRQL